MYIQQRDEEAQPLLGHRESPSLRNSCFYASFVGMLTATLGFGAYTIYRAIHNGFDDTAIVSGVATAAFGGFTALYNNQTSRDSSCSIFPKDRVEALESDLTVCRNAFNRMRAHRQHNTDLNHGGLLQFNNRSLGDSWNALVHAPAHQAPPDQLQPPSPLPAITASVQAAAEALLPNGVEAPLVVGAAILGQPAMDSQVGRDLNTQLRRLRSFAVASGRSVGTIAGRTAGANQRDQENLQLLQPIWGALVALRNRFPPPPAQQALLGQTVALAAQSFTALVGSFPAVIHPPREEHKGRSDAAALTAAQAHATRLQGELTLAKGEVLKAALQRNADKGQIGSLTERVRTLEQSQQAYATQLKASNAKAREFEAELTKVTDGIRIINANIRSKIPTQQTTGLLINLAVNVNGLVNAVMASPSKGAGSAFVDSAPSSPDTPAHKKKYK